MGLGKGIPVFGVSGEVILKPACSATETTYNMQVYTNQPALLQRLPTILQVSL